MTDGVRWGRPIMRTKNIIYSAFVFVMHQIFSTLGVAVLAAFLSLSLVPLLRVVFGNIDYRTVRSALTENHVFPIQMVLAIVISFAMALRWKSRAMLYVWVLPTLVFITAFLIFGRGLSIGERLEYFFGTGCKLSSRCFDQVVFTLPLYTSIAYSIGAWLGFHRVRDGSLPERDILSPGSQSSH